MTIIAAADGSALGNPGPAGWAWYVTDDCWAAGGWPHGTNNMGELMAVLDLLQQTAHLDDELHVLCDSQYAINVISKWTPGWKRKGWKKADGKPVMNVELVKALDAAMAGRKVTFEWVKGHAGHEMNEAADSRARAAALAYQAGQEPESGPGFQGSTVNHPEAKPYQTEAELALFDLPEEELSDDEKDLAALALPGDETLADPDPADLFSVTDVPELDSDVVDEEFVIALERSLLTDAVRTDPSQVAALLHPDWYEVGASGRLWTRAEMVASIGPLSEPTECTVLDAHHLDADKILLLWRATTPTTSTLRTSVWLRRDSNWQQRFHQGTPEA